MRSRSTWRCSACGHQHPRWAGRCDDCGAWNTLVEEVQESGHRKTPVHGSGTAELIRLREVEPSRLGRLSTGMPELDFVFGGGIVPGSMTLLGGEPGIGKSTLLMQAAAALEAGGHPVLYASGEESADQLRLRADRLGQQSGNILVAGETRLERVIQATRDCGAAVLVIDSIQTCYTEAMESAPGSVGQVRECAGLLMRFAKESGTAVIVVGHVTKAGGLAGPKTLEHVVDTVLYFEGESSLDYRLLRAAKNRFGSVDELGVFTMTSKGLEPVGNPSAIFLAARATGSSGSAVTALMEGTRPMLVEVQALVAPSGYGTPQRVTTGLDPRRLSVILAVLERRAATSFAQLDVFVQVSGGLKLTEPGADLAVAAALISSLRDRATPADAIYVGELGLAGEIRPVGALERRLVDANRLGFSRLVGATRTSSTLSGIRYRGLEHVEQLETTLVP